MKQSTKLNIMRDIVKIEGAIELIDDVLETYKGIDTRFYCIAIEIATAKSILRRIETGFKDIINEYEKIEFGKENG